MGARRDRRGSPGEELPDEDRGEHPEQPAQDAPVGLGRHPVADVVHDTELQERVFNAFLAATQDLLDPLTVRELEETDRALRGLMDVFETRLAR